MVHKFRGLKTNRDDLQQEALILLWKLTDKLNTVENPVAYFVAALRNIFVNILIDEHKQGLWSTDSIYKQYDSEEYNLLDVRNCTTDFNYNFYDPWLENYYKRRREYKREYYRRPEVQKYIKEYNSRPEVRERMRIYRREYYNNPENKEKLKEYRREYNSRSDIKAKKNEYTKEYNSRPENKERIKEYKKEYYSRPEVKEKQREHQKKYASKPENKAKIKERMKEYNSRPEVKEQRSRNYIKNKLKKNYKEAATMTLEELKNNYEKIEDEILELMVDLDLLRAIENPDDKIKRKIFSKGYELESLQYIKEDIKNEIEKRNTNN